MQAAKQLINNQVLRSQTISRVCGVESQRYYGTTDYIKNFWTQSKPGKINFKAPYKVVLEAGKTYDWCLCGLSQNQPLCDGSHLKTFLQFRPVRFTVTETKEYSLCMCKQTKKRPFCDGTHRQDFVQTAVPDDKIVPECKFPV